MDRAWLIAFGAAVILCIGTCVYFVAGITTVSPPIKTYNYEKGIGKLKGELIKLSNSNKNITYRVIDITGNADVGFKYYMSVFIQEANRQLEYHFFYDKTDYWFKKDETQIGLVFAYDKTHNVGGYSSDANGVTSLLSVFETQVINRLHK